MNITEIAENNVRKAEKLIREKPVNSTWIERIFLMDDAWKANEGQPQPILMGNGLAYVLSRCSLPVDPDDLLLGRFAEKVPDEAEEARFLELLRANRLRENPIFCYNGGHITLDCAGFVEKGISGYIDMAKERLERGGEDENGTNFLRGMVLTYTAMRDYILRYAEAAEKAGKPDAAAVCRNIAYAPPKTFREALQLMILLFNVYMAYGSAMVACLNFGRIDDFLLPLYEADLAAGRMTREEAGAYFDDFSCKCSLHLGRGEHQMFDGTEPKATGWDRNPTFDSPTYVDIGGYSYRTDHKTNPLTRLFAEHIHPKLKNPVFITRLTKEDDPELFRLLCDKARQNATILFYNDETEIPAFRSLGIDEKDALDYSMHPCNWPDISGGSGIVGGFGGPVPIMLLNLFAKRRDFTSVDEIISALAEQFREEVRAVCAGYRARFRGAKPASDGILNLNDVFIEGTVEAARGITNGGARYPALYGQIRSIATAVDMLSSTGTLVFDRKICTFEELDDACKDDFASRPDLLAAALRAPKYGTDDEYADSIAVKLMNALLDVIDEETVNEKGEKDVLSLNTTITDTWYIGQGAGMQATHNGRRKGQPISENLSPTRGVNDSVTALLNSVSKLPFKRLHSGAFNIRLRKDAVAGEEGLDRLCVLLSTFFEQGGIQAQLTVADTAELRDAQLHPENHRDLTVRITGYSAVFNDMTRNAQCEIIARDENA